MNTDVNYPCPLRSEESMELLLDYTAHKLDPQRRSRLEQHMLTCSACAEFCDEHAAVWHALDAWEPRPVSADFNRRLWQRLDEEKAAPWYTVAGLRNLAVGGKSPASQASGWWKRAVPVAVAVLVIAAGFLLDHPSKRAVSPSVSDESRVTVSEAEQVERTLDDIQLLHQFDATS